MNDSELFMILIKFIFVALSAWITVYLIPFLKTFVDDNKDAKFLKFIEQMVKAAEQMYKEPKSGSDKLSYVMDKVHIYAEKHQLSINDEKILRGMIESIVYDMNKVKEEIVND